MPCQLCEQQLQLLWYMLSQKNSELSSSMSTTRVCECSTITALENFSGLAQVVSYRLS